MEKFERTKKNIPENALFADEIEVGEKVTTVIIPGIKQEYISKPNSVFENQVILLMITAGVNKQCYLDVIKLLNGKNY